MKILAYYEMNCDLPTMTLEMSGDEELVLLALGRLCGVEPKYLVAKRCDDDSTVIVDSRNHGDYPHYYAQVIV